MKNAIVLCSGGLDSTTTIAIAKSMGFEIYALSFSYGQKHNIELQKAKKVADSFKAKKHLIISFDMGLIGGSSLTTDEPVPKMRSLNENKIPPAPFDKGGKRGIKFSQIPSTYVPARNTIFLSFALAWAEVLNIFDIFIGVNAIDYSGYPDCRPAYISAYEKMANLATKTGVEGKKFKIHTPLIKMTKAEIIKKGLALGVDYSLTHSCYEPSSDGLSCGQCDSCRLRLKGFEEAGIKDPIKYQYYGKNQVY